MKTQGFTLIELLAVIVILAIIALIATPIVLGIIDDTKESAMLRSAEMYLSGVENVVMRENMNSGGNFRPNECTITNEGNLDCEGKDGIIEVEVNGEKPKNGSIVFENEKIKEVRLEYETSTIVKNDKGDLVYGDSNSTPNELPAKGKTLAEYTWEEIDMISQAGVAREYFNLGDITTIKVGEEEYEVFIVGFNHDTKEDGSVAGITFQMVDCLNTKSKMNSSNTNAGGWESTLMRTYLNGDVYNSLSSDLQSVIKTVNKSSDKGQAAGNGAIATTADKLWLFSGQEIHGYNYYDASTDGGSDANKATKSDGTKYVYNLSDNSEQYEYFKNLAQETTTWNKNTAQSSGMFNRNVPSLYKKVNGSAACWWLRSSLYNLTYDFCSVYASNAYFGSSSAYDARGVCFGFCI